MMVLVLLCESERQNLWNVLISSAFEVWKHDWGRVEFLFCNKLRFGNNIVPLDSSLTNA